MRIHSCAHTGWEKNHPKQTYSKCYDIHNITTITFWSPPIEVEDPCQWLPRLAWGWCSFCCATVGRSFIARLQLRVQNSSKQSSLCSPGCWWMLMVKLVVNEVPRAVVPDERDGHSWRCVESIVNFKSQISHWLTRAVDEQFEFIWQELNYSI